MNLAAAIAAFTEFCKSITAIAQLLIKFAPYLMEWANQKDQNEIKTLLDRPSPANEQRALLLSARIREREAECQRPV